MVKCILDGSAQQRQEQRRAAGTLRSLQHQPATVERYKAVVKFFFDPLEAHGEDLPDSTSGTDDLLAEFIEDCWLQGEARSLIGDVLSGLQHFCPQLRRGLHDAWRLFGTWSKNEVPTRARPLLPEQVLAMAGFALLDGDVAMAAALLVSFNGLLRPIEVMLQANQATFDFARGTCHLDLGLTKKGMRAGIAEHVVIDDPEAALLLGRVLANKPAGAHLQPNWAAAFRRAFAKLVSRIGASPGRYKPYYLRRGGATHHWRTLGNLGLTTVRGHWRHQTTARIYLQYGVQMLEKLRLSPREKQLIALGKRRFEPAVISPSLLPRSPLCQPERWVAWKGGAAPRISERPRCCLGPAAHSPITRALCARQGALPRTCEKVARARVNEEEQQPGGGGALVFRIDC